MKLLDICICKQLLTGYNLFHIMTPRLTHRWIDLFFLLLSHTKQIIYWNGIQTYIHIQWWYKYMQHAVCVICSRFSVGRCGFSVSVEAGRVRLFSLYLTSSLYHSVHNLNIPLAQFFSYDFFCCFFRWFLPEHISAHILSSFIHWSFIIFYSIWGKSWFARGI